MLKGNEKALEITSNQELLNVPGVETPFHWEPNAWYHLKARVDVAPDGSGVVRAKAWKKGDPNRRRGRAKSPSNTSTPAAAPACSVFPPKPMRVFIDNVAVTALINYAEIRLWN